MSDLLDKEIFGKVKAHLSVQEWQKRILPHRHILLIMYPDYKPKTSAQVDKFVSAEIPSEEVDKKLYDIVVKHNIYSP